MKNFINAITAILAIPMAAHAAPRLVVSTPSLVPESQIDLVLDSPVVEASELGKTTANDWMEIQPAFPGKLIWKAQNIAQFVPELPPAIGATYTFAITKNHAHLDKSAVPEGKFATLSSEAFRVVMGNSQNRWSQDYSVSDGEWTLAFNDDVDPTEAVKFISFSTVPSEKNPTVRSVPAKVERATYERAGYYGTSNRSWSSRAPGAPRIQPSPQDLCPNVLIVSPAAPLPVGKGWELKVAKNLPNGSSSARTVEASSYPVGDVNPFVVAQISALVSADEPRVIEIVFNQPLGKVLPADFLTTSLEITPRPQTLNAELNGRKIILTGSLTDADKYTVKINGPFASRSGLTLASPSTKEVKFQHLDPELILPSDNQAQLANGSRTYQVQTVNLSSIHVRVKKLAGADLIRAFQGYRHYTGVGPDGKGIEPTAPLPYSLVVGETVFEKEIPLGNGVDTSKLVTLNWNDLLPADLRNTALFLDITGSPHPDTGLTGRRNSQAIIQLTDIGLAWKFTEKEAVVYAFSCDTGVPLSGVRMDILGEDSAVVHSTVSDASGMAHMTRSAESRHLSASLGGDAYLTEFDSTLSSVGLWHFPIRYSWNKSQGPTRRAFLFSDRSLYRPGETVRMKGIVRTQNGNAIESAESATAQIVVIDPTDKEIHTAPVKVSATGSFDFTYSLPTGKTGVHIFRLEYPDEIASASDQEDDWYRQEAILQGARFELPVHVEDFRRNAFEIEQKIADVAPGATSLSTDLTAMYYQGQPVAAGQVKHFSRVTTRNPYPERFRDYLFGNHRSDDWTYWYHYFGYRSGGDEEEHGSVAQSSQIQGEAQLSAEGKVVLATEIPQSEFPTTREVTISSEVTDTNNQTLTSTATTTVHPSSVYAGISRIDRLVRAGDSVPLRIIATDTAGEPYPGSIKVTATLTREVNSAVKSRNQTGATTTRNDVVEETVMTSELTIDPAASAGQGTPFTINPKASGRHFLTVRGVDPEGRPFATVSYFNAYGTNEYPWQYEEGMRVKLVAEKKSYKPGETARVLVLSPIEGTALVTVEREKVLRNFVVQLKADNPVIEIPLKEGDAPNAYVSVLIVKGAKESAREHKAPQLRLGYCELIVENLRDTLAVTIRPESPVGEAAATFRPGDEVTVTGTVMLSDGKPAVGAEITLYAEDEGTLAVMGYKTPRPMDYFYKPRVLDVETGTSFESFISEDPDNQYFHNKGFFIGGGGDMTKLTDLLRKNFDPCATWAPALIADGAGKFTHAFKVPDTLTRYRIIAVAHQDAARFGHMESSIIVKKDLMLEPKTPRFANQSDTFDAQVLVQNASEHSGTWEIRYQTANGSETPCAAAIGSTSDTVTLEPGASTTVVFPTRADHTGEAVLTWTATPVSLKNGSLDDVLKHKLSDAVETRLPINYPMPLIRQAKLVHLAGAGAKSDLREQFSTDLLDGTGDISLEFSRSPLVEAAGSIDFLLSYPHGCVEQTTSSLIPWLAVEELKPVIPSFAKIPEKKVADAIQAGADRLLSMQLPDGSFSYWPGNTDSVKWATGYAGMGLLMAVEKGASVPQSAIDGVVKNLVESLRGIADEKSASALEMHCRNLMVLSLGGSPQSAYRNVLLDRVSELTPSARCLLATAIALEDEGNENNLAVAKQLLTSKVPFKLKQDDWMPWTADDAYHLIAWLAVEPQGQEPVKALDRMLHERNPYGQWRTTWVNGWSLMAMAAYAKNDELSDDAVSISLGTGTSTETISLTTNQPVATRSFKLGPDLKLDLDSDKGSYVRVNLASKPKIAPIQPVATNGLSVDRIYERVLPDGKTEFLTEPKVGDLIRVSLRVTLPSDDSRYMVIEDPLPSSFETVNSEFKSQATAAGIATSANDWQISHSELRTDRAVFFLDQIWRKGTYTVTYLARCTVAGRAVAPPAKVESMYNPENFALSASREFRTDQK